MYGKLTCETLKKVRKQIADANGIPYEPAVCNHKGDCPGTCPACEAEVRYIERELAARKRKEGHLNIVGVAKDLLPSYESMAKHAAAVAIATATSLSVAPVDACAQESRPDTVVNVERMVRFRGVVKDDNGVLPGASVTVKGTDNIVETDDDGDFVIEAPIGSSLIIEYDGYESAEVAVSDGIYKLEIRLGFDDCLTEITVEREPMFAGGVSGFSGISIEELVPYDASASIAALFTPVSGQPGIRPYLKRHGKLSLIGDDNSVMFINGIPLDAGVGRYTGNAIESANVESVSVSPTGYPYGRQFGNSIFVSKREGGSFYDKKNSIQYKGDFSVSQFTKRYRMMDLQEYASYYSDPQVANEGSLLFGRGTDWQDELFRTALGHKHHLSFWGTGKNKIQYDASFDYSKQQGVLSDTDYERIGGRAFLKYRLGDRLDLKTDVDFSHYASNEVANIPHPLRPTVSNYKGVDNNILVQTLLQRPYSSPEGAGNLVAEAKNSPLKYEETDVLWRTEIKMKLFGNLDWKSSFSANFTRANESLPVVSFGTASQTMDAAPFREGLYDSDVTKVGTSLFYRLRRRPNDFSSSLFAELENYKWSGEMEGKRGTSTEEKNVQSLAKEIHGDNCFGGSASVLRFNGHVNYIYGGKYLLRANGHLVGGSFFNGDRQWNFYPEVFVKWRLNDEFFYDYSRISRIINYLNLSVHYSETGNSPYSQLVYLSDCYKNNPNLKWERSRRLAGVLDFGSWSMKKFDVDAEISVFVGNNTDLMLDAKTAGTEYGLASKDAYFVNAGAIRNTGFEASVNGAIFKEKLFDNLFKWNVNLKYTRVCNEVTDLGPFTEVTEKSAPLGGYQLFGNDVAVSRTVVGRAPGLFYGYRSAGLIVNEAELADYKSATGRQARVGDLKYSAAKAYIGDPNPEFTYAFGTGLDWGPWTLNVQFSGVYGNDVYNLVRQRIEAQTAANRNCNLSADCLGFARIAHDATGNAYVVNASTSMPRPDYDDTSDAAASVISDRYVEDGSYLKIQSLALTYRVPETKLYHWYVERISATISVENLHTFTKYSGYDPENPGCAIRQGVDEGRYPSPRTYRFSVSVKF